MKYTTWRNGIIFFLGTAGLAMFIAGAMTSGSRSESVSVTLSKDAAVRIDNHPFMVRMDDFTFEKNEAGDVVNYRTELSILDTAGTLLKTGSAALKNPLRYKDLYIYQAPYRYVPDAAAGFHVIIADSSTKDTLYNSYVPFGQKTALGEAPLHVLSESFFCDFAFDLKERRAFTRSQEHTNPAFEVMLFLNDSLISSQWIFVNVPPVRPSHGRYTCVIPLYVPAFFSDIEIVEKTGRPLVACGAALVVISVLLGALFSLRVYRRSVITRSRQP